MKTRICTCPVCGREFTCERKERTYCSRGCVNRARGRNSETCVVCGKTFFKPASQKAKTCSSACYKILLSRKARAQDLSAMQKGHKNSPRTASTIENSSAKEWSLKAPDGTVYRFKNLNLFVRTHKDLFLTSDLGERKFTPRAAAMLSCLAPWRREKMRKKLFSWKGWRWEG